jgi:hypothetical protein
MGQGQVGIEAQGLGIASAGLDQPAEGAQDIAQVVVCFRGIRLEPNRFAAMDLGLFAVPLFHQQLAQVGVGNGQPRVDAQGLAKKGNGSEGVAQETPAVGQVIARQGVGGL